MGIPVLNHLLFQGLLVGLNFQHPFLTFPSVHLVLDMVAIIFALYPILIRSLLDLFARYQMFHRTTLQISVIILAIHYFVLLSDVDTEFPQPYANSPFCIWDLLLHIVV